ncbi:Protein-glutamate methylesterase/protein-glutamine glutaminase [Pseudoalteromonas holothuriae]|uniref:Protein-glutamate methylesterase/protein-glutamine glutaminase n=1 Tax=Pseudoalteromonas holothuriae TaxID=2963714 RepID=A0A9W4VSG2_9GAMM|nr:MULTISPECIES: EAL domain-containing response regulator [unclassified Pseudoalteromonas]CAH9050466.1 Protein-glutamate methylesterase/protein-glutamine glutaminase [Pseudoalteromonas sp. CIP111951]CAH9052216.1 Protein-glutamate methylesterase/protein-glutamine glutaminase [Pseudoalteromonas sp. CIP111854]
MDVRESLNVIAIDDNSLILTQLRLLLSHSYSVNFSGFTKGSEALLHIKHEQTDLIFLDLNMPDMDGIEVLRHLSDLNISASIVLLSGEDNTIIKMAKNLAQLRNLNVITGLDKPITAAQIKQLMESLFSIAHSQAPNLSSHSFEIEELKSAVENKQMCLYLQPKVALKNEEIIGAEFLVRWDHPEFGILSPYYFLDIIEQSDLVHDFSIVIVNEAFAFIEQHFKLVQSLTFNINLSVKNLEDLQLPERLADLAKSYRVPPSMIVFEVTESLLIENLAQSLDVLLRLRLKGFSLAIDDFGTGYSSIKQLSQIPFCELKLDRCFIHDCAIDKDKQAIIEATVSLAQKLNLKVVAEGIEQQQDLTFLDNYQIDYGQGYLFALPLEKIHFLKTIEQQSSYTRDSKRNIMRG